MLAGTDNSDKATPVSDSDTADAVRTLVQRLVEQHDAFVISTRVERRNRDSLKVFIDSMQPLTSKRINSLTREIRHEVVTSNLLREDMHIMVSSAGADKPLLDPRQYKKNIGRTLVVTSTAGDEVEGELVAAGEADFTLQTSDKKVKYTFKDVARAVVQLPW